MRDSLSYSSYSLDNFRGITLGINSLSYSSSSLNKLQRDYLGYKAYMRDSLSYSSSSLDSVKRPSLKHFETLLFVDKQDTRVKEMRVVCSIVMLITGSDDNSVFMTVS